MSRTICTKYQKTVRDRIIIFGFLSKIAARITLFYPPIIPSQMEVAPLHCTVDITQKRRLLRNTKETEKM